jgi:uncharacterized repeat protein (TIGR03803 family)
VVTADVFALPYSNGAHPSAALVVGSDGALYGSTENGGTNNYGTLFRLDTNGNSSKLHDFNGIDGANPFAALVVGPDGALYGSTAYLGADAPPGGNGYGTLFRMETNGNFTKLHDFNGIDGSGPGSLVVGPDGALYGSTSYGGSSNNGALFRLQTSGRFTKLHDFNGIDGGNPGSLVMGPDGALYGFTAGGGTNGNGTLFRVETNGSFTKLHDFNGTDGNEPSAALVVGADGALYGSAEIGGSGWSTNGGGYGTLFRLETNGAFSKLHDFNWYDGVYPQALMAGPDGALYGSTRGGGTNGGGGNGTLFRLETNGAFTELYDFSWYDGMNPQALVEGPDGALYGTALYGGILSTYYPGNGTLFRLKTDGTFTKLHDFNGTDGANPSAALVEGPDGALYGSTQNGGTAPAGGYGTLFRVETNGTFRELREFGRGVDGYGPLAALVAGADGALFGSTTNGGTNNYGTLFRVEANGSFTILHDFNLSDGAGPSAALVVGPDGALYGSTQIGGTNGGNGTLFRLATNGIFMKLHDFHGTDGASPKAALVAGPDGALYGSTFAGGLTVHGGQNNKGTLFRLQTNGIFTKLHDFDGTNGAGPTASLVVGPDGALYGSTYLGGISSNGTLFRLGTNGIFGKLQDFNVTNGANPSAALVEGPDGAFYGSTPYGGTNNFGTLFRLETDGAFIKLYDFHFSTNGVYPSGALVVGPDGALYGSTPGFRDPRGLGTLFRLKTDGTFTTIHDFSGRDGSYPSGALAVGLDGALYGSTQFGGTNGVGTLFRLKTDGTFTKLYDFNGTNGAHPSEPMVMGPDGALYGSTPTSGPRQGGILFKVVLNRPPVARCHDVSVSAGVNCEADASVDNGSFDPDAGDTITVRQEPPGPYPLGATPVTLAVMDNHGASNSCTATVMVMDTTPPTINDAGVTPSVLWPPNGKMVEVSVSYTATDDCGGVTNVLVVASNEATNGSAPDWVIEDEHHVQLRAERLGAGSGRVYTITVISTDNAGNSSTKTTTVSVPKSQGK